MPENPQKAPGAGQSDPNASNDQAKKRRGSIRYQIFGGFGILILFFLFVAGFSIYKNQENKHIAQHNKNVLNPSREALNQLKLLVLQSKMYTATWLKEGSLQTKSVQREKRALRTIHNHSYGLLKNRLKELKNEWDNRQQKREIETIFVKTDTLLSKQQTVMTKLSSFDDYEDLQKTMVLQSLFEDTIKTLTTELMDKIDALAKKKQEEVAKAEENLIDSFDNLNNLLYNLTGLMVLVAIVAAISTANMITKPVQRLQRVIDVLSQGRPPDAQNLKLGNNEIGEMGRSVERLADGLSETARFAEQIGNSNLEAEFQPLSEGDVLGQALLNMRANLKKVAEEDRRRNWATEGVAKFSDILRNNSSDLNQLSEEVITQLVDYLGANQGALYLLQQNEEDSQEEPYLYLAAAYAWDRKKFVEDHVYKGDGLVGQAWQESDTLNITEVPEDYIRITSGLGEALPRAIAIVPLKVNEEIYGIVELASFQVFEDYQIDFIEKIGESIASTLASVLINERTSRLLEESQTMTEQMRAQEEEMRQNMEELQATQEEMERTQQSYRQREEVIRQTALTLEVGPEFTIQRANDCATDYLGQDPNLLNEVALKRILREDDAFQDMKKKLENGDYFSGYLQLRPRYSNETRIHCMAGPLTQQEDSSYMLVITPSGSQPTQEETTATEEAQ